MKINQIEAVILTFEVPGSKWNFLLPGTFLLAGDVGGEIKYYRAHFVVHTIETGYIWKVVCIVISVGMRVTLQLSRMPTSLSIWSANGG